MNIQELLNVNLKCLFCDQPLFLSFYDYRYQELTFKITKDEFILNFSPIRKLHLSLKNSNYSYPSLLSNSDVANSLNQRKIIATRQCDKCNSRFTLTTKPFSFENTEISQLSYNKLKFYYFYNNQKIEFLNDFHQNETSISFYPITNYNFYSMDKFYKTKLINFNLSRI